MNPRWSISRAGAFTLVELLCVMAIIAILAALLLPAFNQSKARVKRMECINNLHQLGIGFQAFMHDHDDKFPMAVPTASGGSQEFVQNGYAVDREFYFSYHHFQALSNELSTPVILICPADTRLPATNFAALQNSNVSYFVGVKAEFAKPDSVLAGDRNLTVNSAPNPTILHGDADNRFWWTGELHQHKGNVLFADGRVEEWNNTALAAATEVQLAGADLVLPSVAPTAAYPATGYGGNPAYSQADPAYAAPATAPSAEVPGSNPPVRPVLYGLNQPCARTEVPAQPQNRSITTRTNPAAPDRFSSNAPVIVTTVPAEPIPKEPTFDDRVAKNVRRLIFGAYLLVLVLFLLRLAHVSWRRWHREKEQQKAES